MDSSLLIYLALGSVVGILAGLFGVGGGVIVVPALLFTFHRLGIPDETLMHIAIGTSNATIIVTSISSSLAHHKRGSIDWNTLKNMLPGIIAGALLIGPILANWLPAQQLRSFFAVFLLIISFKMILNINPKSKHPYPPRRVLIGAGSVIGTLSSMLGIGGGAMTVPFLSWRGVEIRQAVGTSSACGLPIALASTVGFIINGWNQTDLSSGQLGYVYLPAFFGIVVASFVTAKLGAMLAHHLPTQSLRRGFGILLLAVSLKILFFS